MAPVPLQKQEQKKTHEKRLYRTVSGALLLSKQERNRAVSGVRVRQRERARRGRLRTGHGLLASGLPEKRRQPAAAKPEPIRAESQKPKAKSQKPKAKSQKPKAESQKPKAKSQKPKAPARPTTQAGLSRLGRAFPGPFPQQAQGLVSVPATRSNPASGRMHGPGSTAKTGAKKDPLKTPPSHGFRGFAAIESGAKSRRFPGRGFAERAALLAGWRAGLGPAFHARHCLACCWARHRAA